MKMSDKIPERYETWLKAYGFAALLVLASYFFGDILSKSFIDTSFTTGNLKVLDKNNSLTFLSVLLAIQIPLFILFLEQMAKAGFVRRKSLPRVTNFKEIILVLIACSVLIVFSARAAYLYFPVIVAILINLIAVYRSVTVTFHSDQYDKPIQDDINNIGGSSFKVFTNTRSDFNEFYESLEKASYVTYSYLKRKTENMKSIRILATQTGYIENIDASEIDDIMADRFNTTSEKVPDSGNKTERSKPQVVLGYRPSTKVDAGDKIGTLYAPVGTKGLEKLAARIAKSIDISPRLRSTKYLDEIFSEFNRAFRKGIEDEDTEYLEEYLNSYNQLLTHIDMVIQENIKEYSLQNAYQDLAKFNGNDFSAYLYRMYELLSDSIELAIFKDKPEAAKSLISSVYRKIIEITHNPFYTSIARYDQVLSYSLSLYVYDNHIWNKNLTVTQIDIKEYILMRFNEHTDQLKYDLKSDKVVFDIEETLPEDQIKEWYFARLNSVRRYMLASIKNNKSDVYTSLLKNLNVPEAYDMSHDLPIDVEDYIKANVFLIAGYLQHANKLESNYGNPMLNIINEWSNDELLKVLLDTTEKDYADSWNIDTYDHLADGVMRSVPNYDEVLVQLWVEIMLAKPSVAVETRSYGNAEALQATLLFSGALSNSKDTTAMKYLANKTGQNVEALKTLIQGFIEIRTEWESDKLAKAELDVGKVDKYKELVTNTFNDSSVVKKLYNYMNSINLVTKQPKVGFKEFGINQLFDKEAFISDWHSGYMTDHFAEQLGRDIAQGEDVEVLGSMFKDSKVAASISDAVKMTKKTLDKWAVIFVNVHGWEIDDTLAKYIENKEDELAEKIKGLTQPLPNFKLFNNKIQTGIYFVPLSKIGVLHIFADDIEYPVRVEINDYAHSEDMMKELLNAKPSFLTEKGNVAKQKKFLNTKVRMYVNSIFKYDVQTGETIFVDYKK